MVENSGKVHTCLLVAKGKYAGIAIKCERRPTIASLVVSDTSHMFQKHRRIYRALSKSSVADNGWGRMQHGPPQNVASTG